MYFIEQLIMDKDYSTTVSLNQLWWTSGNIKYHLEETASSNYSKIEPMFGHQDFRKR